MHKKETVNLQGIMVGNGATNFHFDVWPSYVDTVWGLNIIKQELRDETVDCFKSFYDVLGHNGTDYCNEKWDKVMNLTGDLNWYDLFRKNYNTLGLEESRYGSTYVDGELREYKRGFTMEEYTPWMKHSRSLESRPRLMGNFVSDYMNS
jgi:hypothetical protein